MDVLLAATAWLSLGPWSTPTDPSRSTTNTLLHHGSSSPPADAGPSHTWQQGTTVERCPPSQSAAPPRKSTLETSGRSRSSEETRGHRSRSSDLLVVEQDRGVSPLFINQQIVKGHLSADQPINRHPPRSNKVGVLL